MGIIDINLTDAEKDRIFKGGSHVLKDMPYGMAGDTFAINGKTFEIVDVCERSLIKINRQCGLISECGSLSDYIKEWEARHSASCEPGTSLFIHWFRQI